MSKKIWVSYVRNVDGFAGAHDYPSDSTKHLEDIERYIKQCFWTVDVNDVFLNTSASLIANNLNEYFLRKGEKVTFEILSEDFSLEDIIVYVTISKSNPNPRTFTARPENTLRLILDDIGRWGEMMYER